MNGALGQIILFGVAAGLSPIPIVGTVVILGTPRARVNGPALLAGWLAGILVVGGVALAISGGAGANADDQKSSAIGVVQIAFGVALLVLAAKQFSKRPRAGEPAATPKWMNAVDDFSTRRCAALGVALSALNPKNLVLVLSAAGAISTSGASSDEQIAAFLLFTLIATIGVAAPIVIWFVLGDRSRDLLDGMKRWLTAHNAVIMTVLLLLIGALLIRDGIATLS